MKKPEVTYPSRNFAEFFPRNLAEFLHEMSRSFSANFRGVSPRNFAEKTFGEIIRFFFSPPKNLYRTRGVPRRNAKKELFSGADLYMRQVLIKELFGSKEITLSRFMSSSSK